MNDGTFASYGQDALTDAELARLVEIAERSVEIAVLRGATDHPDVADHPAALREPRAAFVTLRRHGRLRGCIGTLAATQPLVTTVADRARAAALDDPRFDPVQPHELDDLEVSVSVLTTPMPMSVDSFDMLVRELRPDIDGLVVEAGPHRATFLPSVWEELPDTLAFLDALWHKAGMPPRTWPVDIRVSRYTAQHAPDEGRERLADG